MEILNDSRSQDYWQEENSQYMDALDYSTLTFASESSDYIVTLF
jgi:hypothetical protein